VRTLDEGLVEEVWATLTAWDPARSQAEARGFIERQPHLVALAQALTEEFDVEAEKAALGLLFLLAKVLEAHREGPLAVVAGERIAEAYEGTRDWMERWDGADPRFLARSGELPQPHLISYLIARFYPGSDAPDEHEAEVRGSLFLVLKTAADALAEVE
jgi:hypothetical protein